jgi:hypothetical protein
MESGAGARPSDPAQQLPGCDFSLALGKVEEEHWTSTFEEAGHC